MLLRHLWLTDFRCYHQIEVDFPAGLTAIVGANGEGKTNLLEAVAYLATLASFRGAPVEALVRAGRRGGHGAGRGRPRGPRAADRGRAGGQGPQPDPGQPPAADPVPRPARGAAGVGVLSRRPGPGQGRPGRAAPLPRRRRWWPPQPRLDAVRTEVEPDPAPAQRPAATGRRAPERRGGAHPRRVERQAGRRR